MARLTGVKSLSRNQNTFLGLSSVGPGLLFPGDSGGDNYIFLRDLVYMAEVYPGWFTAPYLRAALDTFATSIGGDATSPDSPAEYITFSGFVYRPGVGTSHYAVFDSGPFFVLLACLIYERGDKTVWTYKPQFEQVLGSAIRGVNGLIYSQPGMQTTGWGFEDACTSVNRGDLNMATCYHILAYQKLASMALDQGDTAAAASYTATANAFITAWNTQLRRGDGFYDASSVDRKPHVMSTAMAIHYGWLDSAQTLESANALLNAYNTYSVFAGDPGQPGGLIAHRGGIRHMVYPNYCDDSAAGPDIYQNGGSWLGPWTGWVAYALSLVSPAAGKELLQSATYEMLRQYRVTRNAPWEWSYYDGVGAAASNAGGGFLAFTSDEALQQSITVAGSTLSSASLDLPQGTPAALYVISTDPAMSASIRIESSMSFNVVDESIPATASWTLSSIDNIIHLSGVAVVSSSYTAASSASFGGRVTAVVSSGSSTSDLIVRLDRSPVNPRFTSAIATNVVDDFSTDRLLVDYGVNGTFEVTGGELVSTSVFDAENAILTSSGMFTDALYSVRVKSQAINTAKFPSIITRATADGLNGVVVMIGNGNISLYDRIGGVLNVIGSALSVWTSADNTYYKLGVRITGSQVSVFIDDVPYPTADSVTTITGPGYFGAYQGALPTSDAIYWDDLSYSTGSVAGSTQVPAGFTVTSPSDGWTAGEIVNQTSSLTMRNSQGEVIDTWTNGDFVFGY
jgi:hypothetical protein